MTFIYNKYIGFIMVFCFVIIMCGCGNADEPCAFPLPSEEFVGDPMPFFDGNEMQIFYLADERSGGQGYHPWARMSTSDFCEYHYYGEVIPYGDHIADQDIALGTGSVVQDEAGRYHAFYTGHNDTYSPKEAIMHAVSTDLQNWEKLADDTFYADHEYSPDDFRDPYVFYNREDGKYWMLITTRSNNQGVIALYKSSDLTAWSSEKILFENDMGSDANLECPTLIEWNGYWYLTFSDQWPDRVVHYRIAESPDGPFVRPARDFFDGSGFYAARMEKAFDKMYLIGWNGTKVNHRDENDYNWGGSLVSHQIIQKNNGELSVIPVQSLVEKINHNQKTVILSKSETIAQSGKIFHFGGSGYEILSYPPIEGCSKITCSIKINSHTDIFGFTFSLGESKTGTLNLVFDKANDMIGFYNSSIDFIQNAEAQSKVDFVMTEGDELKITILTDNTVTALYINDELALTARMYSANRMGWGIFGQDSDISVRKINVYR